MRDKKKGFTLVELIVVIAIIAIITAVAVPVTMKYVGEAKDSMAENEALNLMNTITESMAMLATKEQSVARDAMMDILNEQMATTEYLTEVTITDETTQFKVVVKAGDRATEEETFNYSVYKVQWGESANTSFTMVPNEDRTGWILSEQARGAYDKKV